MNEPVHVGRHQLTSKDIAACIKAYTAPPKADQDKDFFAWYAYDPFDPDGDANTISDGDLLSPVLLNVKVSIDTYINLGAVRPALHEALRHVRDDVALAQASDAVIHDAAQVFAILDDNRPRGVKLTTLAKVLHRKRPRLLPLYDKHVRAAYVPHPVAPDKDRSWAAYIEELMRAMRTDLQHPAWATEVKNVAAPTKLTPLRALDIVAWSVGSGAYKLEQ